MRQCASRKKSGERTERAPSGDGLNVDEEDPTTNVDEESEDEGNTEQ